MVEADCNGALAWIGAAAMVFCAVNNADKSLLADSERIVFPRLNIKRQPTFSTIAFVGAY